MLKRLKNIFKRFLIPFLSISVPLVSGLSVSGKWTLYGIERCEAHQHLSAEDLCLASHNGELSNCCLKSKQVKFNKVTTGLIDSIIDNQIDSVGAEDDMVIDYIAIGTGYSTDPASSDTQLQSELFRAPPSTRIKSGTATVCFLYVDTATGNGASTTVTNPVSTTVFDLTSASGFNTGDRLQVSVTGGTNEEVTILDLTGSTVTLDPATPLSTTPTAGDAALQMWGNAGMFAGAATGTVNSGTLLNRSRVSIVKDATREYVVEAQLIYTAA